MSSSAVPNPNSDGNSEAAAGTGVFLGVRSSQRSGDGAGRSGGRAKRFDTLWEISALYPCKLSPTSLPKPAGLGQNVKSIISESLDVSANLKWRHFIF